MVWEPSNQNGGFSSGMPWLPVSHDHLNRAVSTLEQDPAAILHHYRHAIRFRRNHPALRTGDFTPLEVRETVLSFIRSDGEQTLFCAFNLSGDPAAIDMPEGTWRQIGAELGSAGVSPDGRLHLGPWQPSLALRTD